MKRHYYFGLDKDTPYGQPAYIEMQGAVRDPGQWFACERPEAPFDDDMVLHDCCPRCLVAVEAAYQRGEKCWGADGFLIQREMRRRLDNYGPAPSLEQTA
jgi:hypothetical protein